MGSMKAKIAEKTIMTTFCLKALASEPKPSHKNGTIMALTRRKRSRDIGQSSRKKMNWSVLTTTPETTKASERYESAKGIWVSRICMGVRSRREAGCVSTTGE
jgi:hypothetical protein